MFISGGMQVLLKLLPGVLLCSRIISVSCQFQDNDNPHGNNSHKEIFQQEIHHKNNKADYNIILTSPKLDATGLEPARPLPLKWLDEIPKRNVVGYERRYTKFRGRYTNRIKKYTYYTPGLHPFETNHQGGNISNNWRYNNWTNHFINPGPDFSDRGRYNNRGRLKLSILETNNLGRDIISIKSRYNDSSVQKHFTSPHLNDRNNLGRRYNDFSVRGRFKAPRIKDSNRNFRNRGRFKLRRHPIDSNNQSHYFANRGDYNNFSVQEHFTSPRLKDNQDHKFVKRDFGFRGRFKALHLNDNKNRDFGIGGGYNDSSVREQFTSPHLNDNKNRDFGNRGRYNDFSVQEQLFTSPHLNDNKTRDFGNRGRYKGFSVRRRFNSTRVKDNNNQHRDFRGRGFYNDLIAGEHFTSTSHNDNNNTVRVYGNVGRFAQYNFDEHDRVRNAIINYGSYNKIELTTEDKYNDYISVEDF